MIDDVEIGRQSCLLEAQGDPFIGAGGFCPSRHNLPGPIVERPSDLADCVL